MLAVIVYSHLRKISLDFPNFAQQFLFLIFIESGISLCLGGIIMFGTFESEATRAEKLKAQDKLRELEDTDRSKLVNEYLKQRDQQNVRVGLLIILFGVLLIMASVCFDLLFRILANL